jgi:hypothetical protein
MQDLKQSVLSYLPVRKEIEIVEIVKEVVQVKEVIKEIPVVEIVEVPREETTLELAKLLASNVYNDVAELVKDTIHSHFGVIMCMWLVIALGVWIYIRGRPLWFRIKKSTEFVIFGWNEGGSRVLEASRSKSQKNGGHSKDSASPHPSITNSATIMNVIEDKERKPIAKDPRVYNKEMTIQRFFQIYEMYLSQFNRKYWRDDLDRRLPVSFTNEIQVNPNWTYEELKAQVTEKFKNEKEV